ncbi:high nitrogen upregulated cytochrome P450 monooxygenase 2 [Trametes elegans]|nr:high nitrogen upregulated cytochrome P450 monooxygenase 2 [Trametes elegans]
MVLQAPLSTERALLATCALAVVSHQLFRRFETYSIARHALLILVPILVGFELLGTTSPPLFAALASTFTFLATLLSSVVIYRLSPFHPLARYPGPLGCRLTKFWMACIGYTGRQHLYIRDLHERYGDVVRIGPNELSFRDPTLVSDMLGSPGVPKGPLMIGRTLSATDVPLPGVQDPAAHMERRKLWNRAMNMSSLKEYEPCMAGRANQLLEVLGRQDGELDIGKYFNYFTYDFMSDMAFGGGQELLRNGDTKNLWRSIEDAQSIATFLGNVPWLGVYLGYLPFASATVHKVITYCRTFTLQRLQHPSQRRDIFHYLSNEDQPEKGAPPVKQLIDDGILAIVAGSDTTSSALTSLFFCLGTHPHVYRRLQAEVDQFYPAGEDACNSKHGRKMHYLNAVINETLRLYPPVPTGTQRQVPHRSRGTMLGSYFVPAGTSMFLHTYSLHRDHRNFSPVTEEFWPERWLVASRNASPADVGIGATGDRIGGTAFVHNETAFIPFSYGPANCVGKQLAMQEMRMVVCAIMQRFDFRLSEGWELRAYDEGFKDFFSTTRPAVPVVLRPRGSERFK